MSERFYEIKDEDIRVFNKNRLHKIPLNEGGESIGKYVVVHPKNDTEYPNEIEIGHGFHSDKALHLDEKTMDKILEHIEDGKFPKDLVERVETEGYDIHGICGA
ncbi:MAG: hypothetical protein JSV92_01570 [archaeon]|nr:MAG: hypothetical protein JSV92_01570 [archaeon]